MASAGWLKIRTLRTQNLFALFYSSLTIGNMLVMDTPEASNPSVKYYRTRQSAGVWTAMAVFVAVISGGSSLAGHDLRLTFSLLAGVLGVWFVGYWILSKNVYFVSSTKAGYRDVFRSREIQFDEVRSANVAIGRSHKSLNFVCDARNVSISLDPMDDSWLSDVKAELLKRKISLTTTACGFPIENSG
jgi:hypothetical protein